MKLSKNGPKLGLSCVRIKILYIQCRHPSQVWLYFGIHCLLLFLFLPKFHCRVWKRGWSLSLSSSKSFTPWNSHSYMFWRQSNVTHYDFNMRGNFATNSKSLTLKVPETVVKKKSYFVELFTNLTQHFLHCRFFCTGCFFTGTPLKS